MERFMKNKIFFLAITVCLSGLQSVNAQGIMNKIKKKVEEVKPTTTTQPTQTATGAVKSNGKLNVKDVFREAAPLLQITATANADKVITQTFAGENRIAFKVPGNLGMSTEGTLRTNGEAKIFPTTGGGGMFAVTYTACTTDNMCDNQMQLILIENNQEPQLATGLHLATIYTPSNMVIELLKANKSYKKPIQTVYKPNVNFAGNKLNYVVDCADGNCQNSFVVRSFSFDGEKFVESK
jgi:hypothetical protein